jgi:hypothetical protein
VLWVGGTANRNRDAFELTFKNLVERIEKELQAELAVSAQTVVVSISETISETSISETSISERTISGTTNRRRVTPAREDVYGKR